MISTTFFGNHANKIRVCVCDVILSLRLAEKFPVKSCNINALGAPQAQDHNVSQICQDFPSAIIVQPTHTQGNATQANANQLYLTK